jgi:LysM repeat protein
MVVGVLLSVPFAAVVMVGSLSADADTTSPSGQAATGVVVVQPGESLWQIARQVAPHADPRATLTVIRDLNGLGGDTVVPGQALVVPNPA